MKYWADTPEGFEVRQVQPSEAEMLAPELDRVMRSSWLDRLGLVMKEADFEKIDNPYNPRLEAEQDRIAKGEAVYAAAHSLFGDNVLIGWVRLETDPMLRISNLEVSPAPQSSFIGAALLDIILEPQKPKSPVMITSEQANQPGLNWLQGLGFVPNQHRLRRNLPNVPEEEYPSQPVLVHLIAPNVLAVRKALYEQRSQLGRLRS